MNPYEDAAQDSPFGSDSGQVSEHIRPFSPTRGCLVLPLLLKTELCLRLSLPAAASAGLQAGDNLCVCP